MLRVNTIGGNINTKNTVRNMENGEQNRKSIRECETVNLLKVGK